MLSIKCCCHIAQISMNKNYTYWPEEQVLVWRLPQRCMTSQRAPVTSPWLTGTRWAHRIHPIWLLLSLPPARLTILPLKQSHCSMLNTNGGKYSIPNLMNGRNLRKLYQSLLSITITDNYNNVEVQYVHSPDFHTRRQMGECLSHQDITVFWGLHPDLTAMYCNYKEISVATLFTWQSFPTSHWNNKRTIKTNSNLSAQIMKLNRQ